MEAENSACEKPNRAKSFFLKTLCAVRRYLSSYVYPFITAAFMLLFYYLSLDLAAIYFLAANVVLILLVMDDLTPFITIILFINVTVSYKNSPQVSAGGSDYFLRPEILAQVITVICVLIALSLYRIIRCIVKKQFKLSPMFFGLCALSAAFALNGIFSPSYTYMDTLYGIFQAFIYLGVFVLLKDGVKTDARRLKQVAYSFTALSVLLVVELAVSYYLHFDELIVGSYINRGVLIYGWGFYNTMGLLLLVCVPSVIYLATQYRHGYLFTLYSAVLGLACIMSLSRQTIMGVAIIYPLCVIHLYRKKKNIINNTVILVAALSIAVVVVAAKWSEIYNAFKQIFDNIIVDGELNGSNRMHIYGIGINDYKNNPIFGIGWHSPDLAAEFYNPSGQTIIPHYYHNTIVQILASCGTVGIIAYAVHRAQTIISLVKNPSSDRCYIALTGFVIVLLSLVDVHLFSICPTFIYSSMLALFSASEVKK